MTATLQELIAAPTAAQIDESLLDVLEALGMPTTSWRAGGVTLSLVEGQAETTVALWALVAAVTAGGYLRLAKGAWLTLLARELYKEERQPATFARHTVVLRTAAGAGPHTVAARSMWLRDPITGRRFVGPLAGTVLSEGSQTVVFEAEVVGLNYNLGANALSELLTPLPGVSIDSSELLTQGHDQEPDVSLQQRCEDKWGTIGIAANEAGYRYWARSASTEVTRVSCSVDFLGDITLWLAGASGGINSGVANDVATWIDTNGKRPLGILVHGKPATNVATVWTLTVQVLPGYEASVATAVTDLIRSYLAELSGPGVVQRDEVLGRINVLPGVVAIPLGAFTSPSADVAFLGNQVPTLGAVNLTVTTG